MELTYPMIASIAVVVLVVIFQLIKFIQNRMRIRLFSNIFAGQDYYLNIDGLTVTINGTGNNIFDDIMSSINGYLQGTQGAQVDFQLLKDSVDRHCDMIEDEINSQMPLPLYFGLAGTMTGAIIGLFALVLGDSILELMSGTSGRMATGAATNINDLLWGVAIAMIASAIGIILTSLNTIYFKNKKLKEETEKNKFLAWMQSKVLPAVPTDVSQQMKSLASQLAIFNRNFKKNTDAINETMKSAREVFQSQADVIEKYNSIDLEGIAKKAARITQSLGSSTESLDNFTQYLDTVHSYYKEMQDFAEQLNKETERIGILKDIQRYFQSHKAIIAEETTEAHKNIQSSIREIQNSTEQQVKETYVALTEQSQKLRSAVKENNEQFSNLCKDMREKFEKQMEAMPAVAKQLEKLEELPNRLEKAVESITKSQERLASDFLTASKSIANAVSKDSAKNSHQEFQTPQQSVSSIEIPDTMKWTVIVGIILMTIATIGNAVYTIWKGETAQTRVEQTVKPANK